MKGNIEEILKVAEKVTKYKRDRYLINGEIVALQCVTCKEAFELSGFNNDKYGVAGKQSVCKACDKKRVKNWSDKNKEKHRLRSNRWNNENQFRHLTNKHNRRARKHGNQGNLHESDIDLLFAVSGAGLKKLGKFRCLVSGKLVDTICVGHIRAVDLDGGHSTHRNIVPISKRVNNLQGKQDLWSWLLTEKGQEVADKECVTWLVEYMANAHSVKVLSYLLKYMTFEEVNKFIEIYY